MAITAAKPTAEQGPALAPEAIPPLEPGDRLTRAEFERRYQAMPQLKKAELIEGIVYMPSPVRMKQHAGPHGNIVTWLGTYQAYTPGAECGDNATNRLDGDNEPQPDAVLRILPAFGGQTRDADDDYIEGAPELVAEVAASSASYDLHAKKNAYRRNGVREYIVWLVREARIIWWRLEDGEFVEIDVSDGPLRSEVFPGLWLNPDALLSGDMKGVLDSLQAGINSPEHAAFCEALAARHENRGNR